MLGIAKTVLTTLLIAFVGIHAYFYLGQRQLMYFPSRERVQPQDVGLADVEEISLQNASPDAF